MFHGQWGDAWMSTDHWHGGCGVSGGKNMKNKQYYHMYSGRTRQTAASWLLPSALKKKLPQEFSKVKFVGVTPQLEVINQISSGCIYRMEWILQKDYEKVN